MTIKQLKSMIAELPDEMQIVFCGDGENFFSPCLAESGVIEFGDPCDEKGNLIPDDNQEPIKMFALFPHIEEETN